MNKQLKQTVMTALLAALTCAATMSVRIPVPGTQGYIHPGDALVILSGIFLGPFYGFLAAGIGSALADLLGGYLIYVPITFAIKGLIGLLCGLVFRKMNTSKRNALFAVGIGGIIDIVFVAAGYCLCESFLYSPAAALASVPANIIQGIGGFVLAIVLYPLLSSVPELRQLAATNTKS